MGLITKEVEMKWSRFNKDLYISKGYIFTKLSDKFIIKVEDLSEENHTKIDVKCDNCSKKVEGMEWRNYKRSINEHGKYCCYDCAIKLYGSKNSQKTKLANSQSLEQWCIENNRQDVLNRWDYELNDCNPNEVSYGSNKKYWFKCPKGIHKSEQKIIYFITDKNHTGNCICHVCNSFAQWGIDNLDKNFLEKYWDWDKNNELGINPWTTAKRSRAKVWIKCLDKEYHGSYFVNCSHFVDIKRCPYCTPNSGKVHLLDSLGTLFPEVLKIWSSKNGKTPYEYNPRSNKYVWWKCPEDKHEEYKRTIDGSNYCNFNCPECVRERDESFLQGKVRTYLNEIEYDLLHEYKCSIIAQNPKIKNKKGQLPYDNEVIDLKLIIEVHGEQHYKINTWHKILAQSNNTTPEYELHYQKLKDRYKRIFAKLQKYEYLEVPYWTEKNDEYKILIDNKINEILSNNKLNIIC